MLLSSCGVAVLSLALSDSVSSRRSLLFAGAAASTSLWTTPALAAVASDATSLPPLQPPPGSTAPLRPGGSARLQPEMLGDWPLSQLRPKLTTELGRSRILASELQPLQQNLPFSDQELYYAPFLFGAWNATATLKRKVYPYGADYLPSKTLLEGSPRNREEQVGNTCAYEVHYFSTLANTLQNQLTVNLGTGVPETRIIQDRAFNARSISKAYKQLAPVRDVRWDYRRDPTRVVLDIGPGVMADDLRPLGPRRTEIFWTARQSETSSGGGDPAFACAERGRAVALAPGNVVVEDLETVTEFHKQPDSEDHVAAVSRIAVYLTPNPNSREGVLWQKVQGKAVAFFDYEIDMRRIKESFVLDNGTRQERACVTTPKDIVQCY